MKIGLLTAFIIATSVPVLAQTSSPRATLQQSLGFEDQSSKTLTGWSTIPPDTVSADDHIFHSGHWSVRLQRDAQSAGTFSVIGRSLPIDFHGGVVELRGYLRLQDVSEIAGLWLRENADGQPLALENMTVAAAERHTRLGAISHRAPYRPSGPKDYLRRTRRRHRYAVGRRPRVAR